MEQQQLRGAEQLWAENMMGNSKSHLKYNIPCMLLYMRGNVGFFNSEKSTFRGQFREMLEGAVRKAIDDEKTFNQSIVSYACLCVVVDT